MNNTIDLDKNFFFGGKATFTIESEKTGAHRTFKIRQPKQNDRFTGRQPFFVSLLTGPDNENSYSYIGMLDENTGDLKFTRASRHNDSSPDVVILRWFMKHLFSDGVLQNAKVHHEGKCGCCGRTLTVPESIRNGIGPECMKRFA